MVFRLLVIIFISTLLQLQAGTKNKSSKNPSYYWKTINSYSKKILKATGESGDETLFVGTSAQLIPFAGLMSKTYKKRATVIPYDENNFVIHVPRSDALTDHPLSMKERYSIRDIIKQFIFEDGINRIVLYDIDPTASRLFGISYYLKKYLERYKLDIKIETVILYQERHRGLETYGKMKLKESNTKNAVIKIKQNDYNMFQKNRDFNMPRYKLSSKHVEIPKKWIAPKPHIPKKIKGCEQLLLELTDD